jgi:hypothetical protein
MFGQTHGESAIPIKARVSKSSTRLPAFRQVSVGPRPVPKKSVASPGINYVE